VVLLSVPALCAVINADVRQHCWFAAQFTKFLPDDKQNITGYMPLPLALCKSMNCFEKHVLSRA